ncbi:MAG: class I SAM-dependent methyltransferase [Myxococcota bacterium]|nr:class I SAM-dependent methyltransferase [Myxococcota bacterium]
MAKDYVNTYLSDMGRELTAPTEDDGRLRARVLRHHLRQVLPRIARGPAADLGCGRGEAMLALRSLDFRPVVGCEIGAEQLRAGRGLGMEMSNEDAVSFVRRLPPQALVTAFDVIEHLEPAYAATLFGAVRENLRPGAWFVLQCPNAASPFFGSVQYADPTHRTVFGPGILSTELRKAGFGEVRVFESSPVPHGPVSFARALLWSGLRGALRAVEAVETGNLGGGPYTRVLLAAARKPMVS